LFDEECRRDLVSLPIVEQTRLIEAFYWRNELSTSISCISTILYHWYTAVELLGGSESARVALFYLLKYLVKDATKIQSVLSLMQRVRYEIERHPSRLAATPTRTALYFLTRIISICNLEMELAGTQVTAMLVGLHVHSRIHMRLCHYGRRTHENEEYASLCEANKQ
jgi:hypothetical protein